MRAQQHRVGVGVVEALARRELRWHRQADRDQLLGREDRLGCGVQDAVHLVGCRVVAEPAAHREHLLDRDVRPVRDVGPVLRDGVVQTQQALVDELEDDRAGPGLGDAADADVVADLHRLGSAERPGADRGRPVAELRRAHLDDRAGDEHVAGELLQLRLQFRAVGRHVRGGGRWGRGLLGACRHCKNAATKVARARRLRWDRGDARDHGAGLSSEDGWADPGCAARGSCRSWRRGPVVRRTPGCLALVVVRATGGDWPSRQTSSGSRRPWCPRAQHSLGIATSTVACHPAHPALVDGQLPRAAQPVLLPVLGTASLRALSVQPSPGTPPIIVTGRTWSRAVRDHDLDRVAGAHSGWS